MKDDEKDLEQIVKYHKGLLKDEALREFFEREKYDSEFSAKVKSYREIIDGIIYFGKQKDLADSIKAWEQEYKQQVDPHVRSLKPEQGDTDTISTVNINRRRWYIAAAATVLLLVVSYLMLYKPSAPGTGMLYEAYFQPYPNIVDPTVRGENADSTLSAQAFKAYDEGNFNEASKYFQELLVSTDNTEANVYLLYLANCYLVLDLPAEARDALLQVTEQSNLYNQAQWYLGLAYLRLDDPEKARTVLENLTDGNSGYNDKAKELVRQIDK